MHKFTKAASREREKQIKCHSRHFLSELKCNLHAEHKWMQKFTKVASVERETQLSCHHTFWQW